MVDLNAVLARLCSQDGTVSDALKPVLSRMLYTAQSRPCVDVTDAMGRASSPPDWNRPHHCTPHRTAPSPFLRIITPPTTGDTFVTHHPRTPLWCIFVLARPHRVVPIFLSGCTCSLDSGPDHLETSQDQLEKGRALKISPGRFGRVQQNHEVRSGYLLRCRCYHPMP